MGRSEAGLTAACTVKQDLKRWQGSGVWLPVWWRQQSWPQELLRINQLRMVRLQIHNLSSKEVTFRSLNKLGNSESFTRKDCTAKIKGQEERKWEKRKNRKGRE